MQLVYNSPHYCVLEFSDFETHAVGRAPAGGFEIMDKALRREIFLAGADAARFRDSVRALAEQQPSPDDIDEFLGGYTGLMTMPVVAH